MDRETYIAPIVEAYIPDATHAEKLALTQEFWTLFDALYTTFQASERFDSEALKMVKSESPEPAQPQQNL
jgi:hypothetical protein